MLRDLRRASASNVCSDGVRAKHGMGDQERFANEIEGALHIKEQEKIISQVCAHLISEQAIVRVCARHWFHIFLSSVRIGGEVNQRVFLSQTLSVDDDCSIASFLHAVALFGR